MDRTENAHDGSISSTRTATLSGARGQMLRQRQLQSIVCHSELKSSTQLTQSTSSSSCTGALRLQPSAGSSTSLNTSNASLRSTGHAFGCCCMTASIFHLSLISPSNRTGTSPLMMSLIVRGKLFATQPLGVQKSSLSPSRRAASMATSSRMAALTTASNNC